MVRISGSRAFYAPTRDHLQVPPPQAYFEPINWHRTALHEIAQRVRQLGSFPASFSDDDFADITLYHYGPQNGFHFTVTVLGWPEERARDFISAQFARTLFEMAGERGTAGELGG